MSEVSKLIIECPRSSKAAWVLQSQREGKKLEQWVNEKLNNCVTKTNTLPEWTHIFSDETAQMLINNGYKSFRHVVDDFSPPAIDYHTLKGSRRALISEIQEKI